MRTNTGRGRAQAKAHRGICIAGKVPLHITKSTLPLLQTYKHYKNKNSELEARTRWCAMQKYWRTISAGYEHFSSISFLHIRIMLKECWGYYVACTVETGTRLLIWIPSRTPDSLTALRDIILCSYNVVTHVQLIVLRGTVSNSQLMMVVQGVSLVSNLGTNLARLRWWSCPHLEVLWVAVSK